jgi:hypothetical protein
MTKEDKAFLENGGVMGNWKFDSKDMIIHRNGQSVISLDKLKTRSDIIGVLFDASHKDFINNEDLGMLARVLDRVFDFSSLAYATQPINIRQTIAKRLKGVP